MAETTASQVVFLEAAPFQLVDDVFATAEYYRDRLGFAFDTFFGEPPVFVIVRRNTARLMFRQVPDKARPAARPNVKRMAHTLDIYIWVSDVDALAVELRNRGADILAGPYDSDGGPGRRELLVRDLNGYHICFGRVLGWPD